MKFLTHFTPTLILIGLVYFLSRPFGSLPALGNFFSPFDGFMQNSGSSLVAKSWESQTIDGIENEVEVRIDSNQVSHVFAKNEEDLYFCQGYISARDRLWQMDFYTRAAAGRLSELFGEKALEYDKYNRKIGLSITAKNLAKILEKDPQTSKITHAYSKGVNAYIASISYKNLPIEYKILGYAPEPWSLEKSLLILMNMRNNLSGGSEDFQLSKVVEKYGLDVANELFPNYPAHESPIIPSGSVFTTKGKMPPSPDVVTSSFNGNLQTIQIPSINPNTGSNNWAISGSKSATGMPILANDPHQPVTLPSMWYQMQLFCPGMNVCGVSIPGCPGIIIGFNKDVAWGVTNTGGDMMDFYKIKFKDAKKSAYLYNNQWKSVSRRIEKIQLKSGKIVLDTILSTHHGPIIYTEDYKEKFKKNVPAGHAMRWVGNETQGSEILAFYKLNRAKNYDDYREAIRHFTSPAQNFVFASNQNDVAITSNGRFPVKWKNQGKYILDGSLPQHEWQGWIDPEDNPHIKNPSRGFVSSANQFPTDPSYPYYLGWRFAEGSRGQRINSILEKIKTANVDSMMKLQNDNFCIVAQRMLPSLLPYIIQNKNNQQALASIKKWDYMYTQESVAASVFELWMQMLSKEVWRDEFPLEENFYLPIENTLFQIIQKDPQSKWFDNIKTTNKKEILADVLNASFTKTIDSLIRKAGPYNAKSWSLSETKAAEINHLISVFKDFSRKNIPTSGEYRMVNAVMKSHGPSWKMVIELNKDWPKAFGIYPGGQSGDPSSKYYDNMIDDWASGKLLPIEFLKNSKDGISSGSSTFSFHPKH
ncbi:MAG: penicillin acylase family protein [Leadbetterella sp.]